MASNDDRAARAVSSLIEATLAEEAGDGLQAAVHVVHGLAGDPSNKGAVRAAGGIEALVGVLHASGPGHPATVQAIEALSFVITDDLAARATLRGCGGVPALVTAIAQGPGSESTHRALLALRVLSDRDADREAILLAGGVPCLAALLNVGPDSEVTQCALAALGNLAAGGQLLKDAIREAGAFPALVALLRSEVEPVAAELAAVVLRNLALGNSLNRSALVQTDGLAPLLRLLSEGQDRLTYPIRCQVTYSTASPEGRSRTIAPLAASCCMDPEYAHLCLVLDRRPGPLACIALGQRASPRDRVAERYSLLRKLTIVEGESETLCMNFCASDKDGAPRIKDPWAKLSQKALNKKLLSVNMSTYYAVEYKGLIMRMLTRMHLEREFNIHRDSRQSKA